LILSFQSITYLKLDQVETLTNLSLLQACYQDSLEELRLCSLHDLQNIDHLLFFKKLTTVEITSCSKLQDITVLKNIDNVLLIGGSWSEENLIAVGNHHSFSISCPESIISSLPGFTTRLYSLSIDCYQFTKTFIASYVDLLEHVPILQLISRSRGFKQIFPLSVFYGKKLTLFGFCFATEFLSFTSNLTSLNISFCSQLFCSSTVSNHKSPQSWELGCCINLPSSLLTLIVKNCNSSIDTSVFQFTKHVEIEDCSNLESGSQFLEDDQGISNRSVSLTRINTLSFSPFAGIYSFSLCDYDHDINEEALQDIKILKFHLCQKLSD
jgi:hypothetical protein